MSALPNVTILFADVCRSTQIFEQNGDVAGRAIVGNCLAHLGEVAQRHGGRVIKTIGDEVLCILPTAEQGLKAGCDMQRRVMSELELMSHNVTIRVGLHHGPVLREANDVFGDAVNVAARMAQLAKSQQIISTRSTADMAPVIDDCDIRSIGFIPVKGKQHPIEIVDVLWQETISAVTMVSSIHSIDSRQIWGRLRLRMGERCLELSDMSPPVMLGRDSGSGLILNDEWVSRIHASIEYNRGYFVLVDRSTNGTYIQPAGDVEVRLHRDELRLRNRGTISLGRMSGLRTSQDVIQFECLAEENAA